MIPVMCSVMQKPEAGTYGDCVRACVASVLELPSNHVPHFYVDGDGERAFDRLRQFLAERKLIPAYFPLICSNIDDVKLHMWAEYAETEYLLFCSVDGGDHCIVGKGDKIIHDPALYVVRNYEKHTSGVWIVIILAKL